MSRFSETNEMFFACPFDGGLLVSEEDRIVRLLLVWKRVGNKDYGIYAASDPVPSVFVFRASYDENSTMNSFVVGELSCKAGVGWEEERLSTGLRAPHITEQESSLLSDMGDAICSELIQTFGKDVLSESLSCFMPNVELSEDDEMESVLLSGLPFQVKGDVMENMLPKSERVERGCVFVTLSSGREPHQLIEKKLYGFADMM